MKLQLGRGNDTADRTRDVRQGDIDVAYQKIGRGYHLPVEEDSQPAASDLVQIVKIQLLSHLPSHNTCAVIARANFSKEGLETIDDAQSISDTSEYSLLGVVA